jgi:alpha-ribazole phosphatase
MTELVLVRHGQTDWNIEGRYQGQSDVPLNETGLAQAQMLAQTLTGEHFDAIYSSDLVRAQQTAAALGKALNLPVHTDRRLREINQGEWEGKIFTDIKARFNDQIAAREKDPLGIRPPGGESIGEVAERVAAAAQDIARAHPNGRVLVVSHGLSIATLIARARGISLSEVYSLIPKNVSTTPVEWQSSDISAMMERN